MTPGELEDLLRRTLNDVGRNPAPPDLKEKVWKRIAAGQRRRRLIRGTLKLAGLVAAVLLSAVFFYWMLT